MAEYTWKQWENEQNEANNIHADDCYRWQAGIELAGGTWDGEWVDLDKTGKGLVTIDQFNALESQIQSKVSSYTPKNYDPSSTVQIVPGVDGWNKVEDGILKAVCEPDGVNRNYLQVTHDFAAVTGKLKVPASCSELSTDEDGFGVLRVWGNGSNWQEIGLITSFPWTNDEWGGKAMVLSFDLMGDTITTGRDITVCPMIFGSNNGTSWSRSYYNSITLFDTTGYITFNTDDYVDNEWFRVVGRFNMRNASEMSQPSTEYAMYRYGIIIYHANTSTGTFYLRKPKLELASEGTDWSYAPEDFGWPDNTDL